MGAKNRLLKNAFEVFLWWQFYNFAKSVIKRVQKNTAFAFTSHAELSAFNVVSFVVSGT